MDGSNNNLNDMNNPVDETAKTEGVTENTAEAVNTETVNTEVHTEATASVFDAQPVEQPTQQTAQSNFAAFDSQPQPNQSYFNYQVAAEDAVMNEQAYAASNSKSTTAMVLGIIAIVTSCLCCCLPVCVILAIISFVMAFKSKKISPDHKLNGKAIAAIVCSSVALLIYLCVMLYFVILGIGFISMYNDPVGRAELNDILIEYGYTLE